MHDIILFVAGMLFVILALPVIQTISDIICTLGQWVLSALNVKVTKNNVKVQDLNDSIEPTSAQAIGFQSPLSSDDYYDDDEDPDEDKMNSKNKNKVGF